MVKFVKKNNNILNQTKTLNSYLLTILLLNQYIFAFIAILYRI